jgi:hypothetical protein
MILLKLKKIVAIITTVCFFSLNVTAQEPLTKVFIDSTVTKIGDLMLDYYIIKDKAEEASERLKLNLRINKYYSLNGGELANALVEDLQSITNDKHIMIKFYPEGDAAPYYLEQEKNKDEDFEPSESSLKRSRGNNYGFKEVSILNANIGYLKLDGFYDIRNPETTKAAAAAMDFLSHANGIIIDLSENSGGDPATLQFLISYFFKVEPATHYNTFHFRDGKDNYLEKHTLPYVPGERKPKMPIYIITSQHTFSAGEALAYALKNLDRATIIGQTTGGGAHAADFKFINDFFDMSIPMARAINPTSKTNWEGVGVKPDVEIEMSKAKVYAHASLIKAAIAHENDEILLASYNWKLEELESRLNEVQFNENELMKFTGNFDGDRRVYLENGKLKYQKGDDKIATLTPLNETSFISNTFSEIRINFDFNGDVLMGLKFYLESGQFYLAKKLD